MEEPLDYIAIIKQYCKDNHNNCSKCEIEKYCDKYFTREPRNWR